MKHRIFIIILVFTFYQSFSQNSIFNVGGNGDFESAGDEADMGVSRPENQFPGAWTFSRANNSTDPTAPVAYSGANSLKCHASTLGRGGTYMTSKNFNQFIVGRVYTIKARVYVPSNSGFGENTLINIAVFDKSTFSSTDVHSCYQSAKSFQVGKDQNDKWVEIHHSLYHEATNNPDMFAAITILGNGEVAGTFYLDKIEVTEYSTTILANGVINGDDIILSPSGGVPNLPYQFFWGDGSILKDRIDVPASLTCLMNVSVGQGAGYPSACGPLQNTYRYYVRPNTTSPEICSSQNSAILSASCVPTGSTLEWYDAPEGGTLLGTTVMPAPKSSIDVPKSDFEVGSILSPGVYKYYVLYTKDGFRSVRSEAVVTKRYDPEVTINGVSVSGGQTVSGFETKPVSIQIKLPQSGDLYNYKFYYTTSASSDVHIDEFNNSTGLLSYTFKNYNPFLALGIHKVEVNMTRGGCSNAFTYSFEVKKIIPLCVTILPTGSGQFKLDKFSGVFVFQRPGSCQQDISFGCIQGKVDAPVLNNVVSASATTFSDDWSYDDAYFPNAFTQTNPFENGRRGKWRPAATYAFNTGGIAYDKNYNSGMFALRHFNWQYPSSGKRMGWIEANHVDKYSPNGEAIEEHNALNISSAAKFGYDGSVPYLIAQNATYYSVMFESFEKIYNNTTFEDNFVLNGGTQVTTTAHAGTASLSLGAGATVAVRGFLLSQVISKGLLIKVWAKDAAVNALQVVNGSTVTPFKKTARTGEWALYEALLAPSTEPINVSVKNQSSTTLFIDDLRIQPQDSEMTAYVYDVKTLRLLTVFDDQHFGLYYQYNAEGKLIRKIIETERGLKTLQETQYNVPVN